MKIYITKCDKFCEEVPFSKWADDGSYHYKEFYVQFLNKPWLNENDELMFKNTKTFSEEELSILFFLNRKDWACWAGKELHKIREIKNYISELDLYAEI